MMHFELRDPNRRLLMDSGRGRDDVRLKRVALEHRTKAFAVRIVRPASSLPRTGAAEVLGRRLVKAGTSIAVNYREMNRAESDGDIVQKIGVVEREAADTCPLCPGISQGPSTHAGLSRRPSAVRRWTLRSRYW